MFPLMTETRASFISFRALFIPVSILLSSEVYIPSPSFSSSFGVGILLPAPLLAYLILLFTDPVFLCE